MLEPAAQAAEVSTARPSLKKHRKNKAPIEKFTWYLRPEAHKPAKKERAGKNTAAKQCQRQIIQSVSMLCIHGSLRLLDFRVRR